MKKKKKKRRKIFKLNSQVILNLILLAFIKVQMQCYHFPFIVFSEEESVQASDDSKLFQLVSVSIYLVNILICRLSRYMVLNFHLACVLPKYFNFDSVLKRRIEFSGFGQSLIMFEGLAQFGYAFAKSMWCLVFVLYMCSMVRRFIYISKLTNLKGVVGHV